MMVVILYICQSQSTGKNKTNSHILDFGAATEFLLNFIIILSLRRKVMICLLRHTPNYWFFFWSGKDTV